MVKKCLIFARKQKAQISSEYYNFVAVKLLRKIVFPISLIYAVVVHFRNFLYDVNIFKSESFKTPTVCVGNLSVGGTGKTPMVEYLITLLKKDFKIAVLSRGYKRKSSGFVIASHETKVEALGDEPYQIHSKFTEVSVAVDADRRNGILKLEKKIRPDIILLDDAFQHRKVKPTVSILLTAYSNLYCDDWYLPTGNLRDGKKEARRADIIIVTKCPKDLSAGHRAKIVSKLKPKPEQKVLFSHLEYGRIRSNDNQIIELSSLNDKRITLVTGIADPQPMLDYLKNEGLAFEHIKFKDHHFFTEDEIATFNSKECILTTEKDYGRLKGRLDNLSYLQVGHSFSHDEKIFLDEVLRKSIKRYW